MSRLDDVKKALLALTKGLTEEEKMWAVKHAFPDVLDALVIDGVAEELSKQRIRYAKNFEDNNSDATVDNTKAKYNIKYDDNIIEIATEQNIDIDIDSAVECGCVYAGCMSFHYDNPEETTIRLTF